MMSTSAKSPASVASGVTTSRVHTTASAPAVINYSRTCDNAKLQVRVVCKAAKRQLRCPIG